MEQTIPVLSFQDGLKLWSANRSKPAYFFFRGTANLLKLISTQYNTYSQQVKIKDEKWFLFKFKVKRTPLEVFVTGFGANQKVIIKKGA